MSEPRGRAVLGVAADYHDSSAALVVDGHVVAAVQEERFTRRKHDPSLPVHSMAWCLEAGGIGAGQLDAVAYHGKPLNTYERILANHARVGPRGVRTLGKALRAWTGHKLWVGYRIDRELERLGHPRVPQTFVEHHLAHAASAFYPSPFDRAAVVTVDGVGEWATTTIGLGSGAALTPISEIRYPHSLGLLYSTITAFCGFDVNDGESKLMGLAPFGSPTYESAIREHLIELRDDGSYRLDLSWFDFERGEAMARKQMAEIFDGPARGADGPLTEREADLACSIQHVLDDALLSLLRVAHDRTDASVACLAGGVALNCVSNGRLLDRSPFDDLWVQPAAGDAGGSLGAALWHHHVVAGQPRPARNGDAMRGAALGPSFSDAVISEWLTAAGVAFAAPAVDDLSARVADLLDDGQIIGWFQGPSEFGPRALGHRSILADARDPASVQRINQAIKRREGFRPLAPAVLAEHAGELFERGHPSPYMLLTDQVIGAVPAADRRLGGDRPSAGEQLVAISSPIPAATHVDGSARVQTVVAEDHPRFHALIQAFYDRTGCPAVLNTSFNVAGEPIVATPADALRCAAASGLDSLVLGRWIVDGDELRRVAATQALPGAVNAPGVA